MFYSNSAYDLRKRAQGVNVLFAVSAFMLLEGITVFCNKMELMFTSCDMTK